MGCRSYERLTLGSLDEIAAKAHKISSRDDMAIEIVMMANYCLDLIDEIREHRSKEQFKAQYEKLVFSPEMQALAQQIVDNLPKESEVDIDAWAKKLADEVKDCTD